MAQPQSIPPAPSDLELLKSQVRDFIASSSLSNSQKAAVFANLVGASEDTFRDLYNTKRIENNANFTRVLQYWLQYQQQASTSGFVQFMEEWNWVIGALIFATSIPGWIKLIKNYW